MCTSFQYIYFFSVNKDEWVHVVSKSPNKYLPHKIYMFLLHGMSYFPFVYYIHSSFISSTQYFMIQASTHRLKHIKICWVTFFLVTPINKTHLITTKSTASAAVFSVWMLKTIIKISFHNDLRHIWNYRNLTNHHENLTWQLAPLIHSLLKKSLQQLNTLATTVYTSHDTSPVLKLFCM